MCGLAQYSKAQNICFGSEISGLLEIFQIVQSLDAQWVFEKCMKTVKSLFSKENDINFEFFRKFKVLLRLN